MGVSVGFITENGDDYFEISKNLDIFGKLYREVNALYVDDVDPTNLMRKGVDAMLGSLDPYTNFISASEIEDFKFMSTGKYGGVGALIGRRSGKLLVLEPYEGYPADKAGLKAGDVILKIDNEVIEDTEKGVSDVRSLLRGQPGTDVILTILRPGETTDRKVKVTRAEVKIDNVPFHGMVNDNIGYISLTGFTRDAGKEVAEALKGLKQINPNLKGVILDVRGNPGGLLNEAVNVSNVFLSQGEKIVETRGKMEGSQKTYKTRLPSVDTDIPLVVMTNSRSASASEIVSGVMQDLDRGVIVGQRSFGKGLVQTTRPLSYNTQVKITTAKYYTPSGRCIQAIDYSHRNDDGSVGRIPDSLQSVFYTKNGRKVYDGGGIDPDVKVDKIVFETVTNELLDQNVIFDFATQFVQDHETIQGPREFAITDDVFQEFIAFAKTSKFNFETKEELQIERVKEIAEEEGHLSDLQQELQQLQSKINSLKDSELSKHKDEISSLLKIEIVKRYYYKEGVIEASFDDDPDIEAAVKVLENPTEHGQLLKGK